MYYYYFYRYYSYFSIFMVWSGSFGFGQQRKSSAAFDHLHIREKFLFSLICIWAVVVGVVVEAYGWDRGR